MVALADVKVEVKCGQCDTVQVFELKPLNMRAWLDGQYIQNVFPELSDDDAETLISWRSNQRRNTPIICGKCFTRIFSKDED